MDSLFSPKSLVAIKNRVSSAHSGRRGGLQTKRERNRDAHSSVRSSEQGKEDVRGRETERERGVWLQLVGSKDFNHWVFAPLWFFGVLPCWRNFELLHPCLNRSHIKPSARGAVRAPRIEPEVASTTFEASLASVKQNIAASNKSRSSGRCYRQSTRHSSSTIAQTSTKFHQKQWEHMRPQLIITKRSTMDQAGEQLRRCFALPAQQCDTPLHPHPQWLWSKDWRGAGNLPFWFPVSWLVPVGGFWMTEVSPLPPPAESQNVMNGTRKVKKTTTKSFFLGTQRYLLANICLKFVDK